MCTAGDKNLPLARWKLSSYTVVAKLKIDRFPLGETRPIARLVHVAVASRRAVQEVDPRFNRLVALVLANLMVASHLGMEAGAPEAKSQTLQFAMAKGRRTEKQILRLRLARTKDGPDSLHGEFGPLFFLGRLDRRGH
jgi:hypothetical protein